MNWLIWILGGVTVGIFSAVAWGVLQRFYDRLESIDETLREIETLLRQGKADE